MRKLVLILLLWAVGLTAGCGLLDTYDQRTSRIKQIENLQWRMFVDDSDTLWLLDRSSNLTQWHPRVGT